MDPDGSKGEGDIPGDPQENVSDESAPVGEADMTAVRQHPGMQFADGEGRGGSGVVRRSLAKRVPEGDGRPVTHRN